MNENQNVVEISDLSEMFTKDNANSGVWKQVITLGKKWDVEVLVLGSDSEEVHKFNIEKQKELKKHISISAESGIEFDDDALGDSRETEIEGALVRFAGIRKYSTKTPLVLKGEEVPTEKTKDNKAIYRNILVGSPDIMDFVIATSNKRNNFLFSGKKN